MSDIFISYSRKDIAFAHILNDELEAKGFETWIDWRDIPPSTEWFGEVKDAIEGADAFVFIVSKTSIKSEICSMEISHAVKNNKRLIPIVLHDIEPKDLPESIAALNWIYFREEDKFQQSFDKLVEAIETDRDWVKAYTRLQVRAIEWESHQRDKSYLLRGRDLKEAEKWLAQETEIEGTQATALEREFILSGRMSAKRRQKMAMSAGASGFIVICVVSAFAFFQRGKAAEEQNTAKSRQIAAKSIDQLGVDPERSLLLAIKAMDLSRTDAAEDALRQSFSKTNLVKVLDAGGESDTREQVKVSADGKEIFLNGDKGIATWQFDTGEKSVEIGGDNDPLQGESLFSPDGEFFVSIQPTTEAPYIDIVKVRDLSDGKEYVLSGVDSSIHGEKLGPNGKFIATRYSDESTWIWDLKSGTRINLKNDINGWADPQSHYEFSDDGKLVSLNDGKVLKIWNAESGDLVSTITGFIQGLAPIGIDAYPVNDSFDNSGNLVVIGSGDGTTGIWEAATGTKIQQLPVLGVQDKISPDSRLVLISAGNTPEIWDITSGRKKASLTGHKGAINDAEFSPDGKYIVTASEDHTARIWGAETGVCLAELIGHDGPVKSAVFTPDSKYVVSAGADHTVRIWNNSSDVKELTGHLDEINDAAFSPDGRLVATVDADKTGRIWDSDTGKSISILSGHTATIFNVSFNADGGLVYTFSDDYTIKTWETGTGKNISTIEGPECSGEMCDEKNRPFLDSLKIMKSEETRVKNGDGAAFNAEKNLLVTPGVIEDPRPRIWDLSNGKQITELNDPGETESVSGVMATDTAISPDGKLIASTSLNNAKLWNASDGKLLFTLRGHTGLVSSLAFSPDSTKTATASTDGTVKIWDVSTGTLISELRGHRGPVSYVEFSPDGKSAVTASDDGTAIIWDVETGRIEKELHGHTQKVSHAHFSSDGKWILTSSSDGSARIWQTDTGAEVKELIAPGDSLFNAIFSPDDARILTYGYSGVARIYDCDVCKPVEELLDMARQRVTRELTCDEQRLYLNEDVNCSE